MRAYQRLGTDDRHDLEDRWEPTIELDEEQAIAAAKLDAALQLTSQHDELLPQRRILGFKPALRREERDPKIQGQKDERDHRRYRAAILSPVQCGSGSRYTQSFAPVRAYASNAPCARQRRAWF